jgi:hypothetical protein
MYHAAKFVFGGCGQLAPPEKINISGGADYCGLSFIFIFEFLTGVKSGKEPPRAPVGHVQTGIASFCKALPTAEQLEQQQLGERQNSRQQGWER